MKNILVTGANGQLGNEMRVLSLENKEYNYFFTDVAELDICDEKAVMAFVKENEIDVIVNCAAYTAVDKAEDNQELCAKLNSEAVGYLAKAAEENQAEFIQISTDYVFDGTNYVPYRETEPTCPNSVYGVTKLAGEKKALEYCSKAMIIRTAWLYSVFGNNFVKTMLRLGRERESLSVVSDQVGTPTYAADLAAAIVVIINNGEFVPGIYNFSDEGVCSWYDFTVTIHRIAGIATCRVVPIDTADYPSAATRPFYSVMNKKKIKNTYPVAIPHWEESLRKCIAILQSQN